jgi:hypothetical protein
MALLVGVSTVVLIPARVEHTFSLGGLWATMALVAAGVFLMRTVVGRARALNFWYPFLLVAGAAAFLFGLDFLAEG